MPEHTNFSYVKEMQYIFTVYLYIHVNIYIYLGYRSCDLDRISSPTSTLKLSANLIYQNICKMYRQTHTHRHTQTHTDTHTHIGFDLNTASNRSTISSSGIQSIVLIPAAIIF